MKNLIIIFSALTLFASCSSRIKKSIEADRESVGVVQSDEEVINKMRNVLENAKISETQKKQFLGLYRSHRADILKIEEDIREYRVVLFKTLVDKSYDQRKFDIVANKLKKLVIKRYDLAMDQYREGKEILGVNAGAIYDDPWFEVIHKF
ncbi:Spy/CpxP family protein refolding chaperone [Halobacteriovorax sp.]|uniref:Spy/CpxP family protein refolding chaperone n=1 Tax=Halobacteriovorax sp. TaxID=2020862 RepID=UPI0035658176